MEEKKDYSLLRPFDLEAAKRGEPFVYWNGSPRQYLGGPDKTGRVAIMDDEGVIQLSETYQENYRMAPLAWVEGKPVYRGDVLYFGGEEYTVDGGTEQVAFSTTHAKKRGPLPAPEWSTLTWTPPMVKREGWVVADINAARRMTKERAEEIVGEYTNLRAIRIEWEEPAGQEGGVK